MSLLKGKKRVEVNSSTLFDFRNSFASLILLRGAKPKVVSEALILARELPFSDFSPVPHYVNHDSFKTCSTEALIPEACYLSISFCQS